MNKDRHGGDIYSRSRPMLDFSSNISPLGLDARILAAIRDAAENSGIYPDPYCRKLRAGISEREGIPAEFIVCSDGAAEMIFNVVHAKAPKRALLMSPCFSEYERALTAYGAKIRYYDALECDGFELEDDFTEYITPDIDMIFLCSPNNPTGKTISKELLLRIIERAGESGAFVVMDECFNDFLDNPEAFSVIDKIAENPQLMVIKAFTKMYALAGIRIGYGMCSDMELVEKIYSIRQPWSVSYPAQAAALRALECRDIPERTRACVKESRGYMCQEFDRLGIEYIKPEANFVFFKSAPELGERMEKRGILLRDCSNYRGLYRGCYRAAVKSRRECEKFIKTLEEELKWQRR